MNRTSHVRIHSVNVSGFWATRYGANTLLPTSSVAMKFLIDYDIGMTFAANWLFSVQWLVNCANKGEKEVKKSIVVIFSQKKKILFLISFRRLPQRPQNKIKVEYFRPYSR